MSNQLRHFPLLLLLKRLRNQLRLYLVTKEPGYLRKAEYVAEVACLNCAAVLRSRNLLQSVSLLYALCWCANQSDFFLDQPTAV